MMRNRLFFAAAFLVTVVATPAVAQRSECRLRIDTNPSSWIIRGYDPFGNSASSGTFDLIFTNDGDAECVFSPVFVLDGEPFGLSAGNGRRTQYGIVDLFAGANATPLAGRTQRRATRRNVVVAPRSQEVVQFQLVVDERSITRDGLHDQRVTIEAESSDGLPMAAEQLVLGLDVLPSATLGLSGAYRVNNGRAMVDLGELQEGIAQVPLQLRVQSTGRYKLTLESHNNGRLQLPGTQWFVPYGLAIDGQSIELAGGSGEYLSPTGQGLRRDSLPIRFRIGDVSDRRAGTYSDVISISVAPL